MDELDARGQGAMAGAGLKTDGSSHAAGASNMEGPALDALPGLSLDDEFVRADSLYFPDGEH